MKIQLYTISKPTPLTPLETHYQKLCKGFGAEVESKQIFSKDIANAQKQALESSARRAYTKALTPFLLPDKAANIALHPAGRSVDSAEFARLFESRAQVGVFIGGAFGFEQEFLDRTLPVSLSPLTFSHTIVGVIVLEQIYRALSLLANHPYHK